MALTACDKQSVDAQFETQKNELTFAVEGDFGAATFTRGAMTADGKQMTDFWVLDYMVGALVQQLHQTAADPSHRAVSVSRSTRAGTVRSTIRFKNVDLIII